MENSRSLLVTQTCSRPESTRSTSRAPSLSRIQSAQAFDDHSVYHAPEDTTPLEEDAASVTSSDTSSSDRDPERKELGGKVQKEGEDSEESLQSGEPEALDGVRNQRDVDLEANRLEKIRSVRSVKDRNLVGWDGPDDPLNPKNWPMRQKWAATFVISSFTFVSPVSSSMVAPALGALAKDLNISTEIQLNLVLSIFVLAYAVGPLFLGPLSEVYGRVPVIQLSNLFYLVWNIACGFAKTKNQMIAFRFLAGLGGSAPLAIGGGVLGDCWKPEQRGKAISIYSLAPMLGPAVGPVAGAWIAQESTWRWVFWSTSIFDACIQISGFFFLQETYAPVLLANKKNKLIKETGNKALHTEYDSNDTITTVLKTALVRPFILLGTQPIIQFIALYMAYLYGLMYLMLSTFPGLWQNMYHESVGIGGLNYISMGLGFFLGTQITAPINDHIYRKLKKRNSNIGRPEFRVPLMFIGSSLIPVGLFWYGWSAQAHLHWIMPNLGAAIFAAGSIVCFQCMQTYIVDSYTRYAASGIAAAVVLRSLAGFGFPLFAPYMYKALGFGWGNSLLGFIGIGLGIPAPFLFWFYGQKLRAKSQFAAGG